MGPKSEPIEESVDTGSAITDASDVDSSSLKDGRESAAVRSPPARSPVPVARVSRPVASSVLP